MRLPEERWAKQALLNEVLKGEYHSDWYQYVLRARGRIAQDAGGLPQKNWKAALKKAYWGKAGESGRKARRPLDGYHVTQSGGSGK